MNTTERPPILDKNGELHRDVKAFITDLNGNLIGVIIVKPDKTFIELLSQHAPLLIYDKMTGETETAIEIYPDDPKKVMRKIYAKYKK